MGWFSTKRRTYVSSVAYNLSGEEEDRVDVHKYTTLQAVLQNRSITDSLISGYLGGQGVKLRRAYDYAREKYSEGVPESEAVMIDAADLTALTNHLERQNPRSEIVLLSSYIGSANFTWWVEEWLTEKYGYDQVSGWFLRPPKGVEKDAWVSYDIQNDGRVHVILTNANSNTHVLDYRLTGVRFQDTYIHSAYKTIQRFTEADQTSVRATEAGDTAGTSSETTETDRQGSRHITTKRTTITIANGETTTLVETSVEVHSHPKYFLYRLGSGTHPALDQDYRTTDLTSPYYPAIPLRVDNEDYTTKAKQHTQLYKTSEAFLKKVGIDLQDVADSINENEQIDEIDYAFIVFGVDLGTESWAGKEYLWRFFQYLRGISVYDEADFNEWLGDRRDPINSPKINSIKINHPTKEKDRHNIELQWQFIKSTTYAGSIGSVGTVETSAGAPDTTQFLGFEMVLDHSRMTIKKQVSENLIEELHISGLVYDNHVYNGHSVTLTAWDAFHEEDENGFILPLNHQILTEMDIKTLTQLSYETNHVVFNSYQVVKQRWYQRGWFRVVLVIAAIVWTVWSLGADGGAGLGWAASLATAAGFTVGTLLFTTIAVTIHVMGMMILSTIIMEVSTELFGDMWGQIVSAVAMIVVMRWDQASRAAAAASGSTTTAKLSLTAKDILQGTTVILQGVSGAIQAKIEGIQEDLMEAHQEYTDEMKHIETLWRELLGSTELLDIQGYMDSAQTHFESPDTFFSRTLLLGSDVVNITNGMIENFSEIGLELPTGP